MPKISIYVPDAMYDELRQHELPISQLAQEAFTRALNETANAGWVERARRRPLRVSAMSTEELMSSVDEEFEL